MALLTLMLGDGREADKTDVSVGRRPPLITHVSKGEALLPFPTVHCSGSDGTAVITVLRLIATRSESAGDEESPLLSANSRGTTLSLTHNE